MAERWYPRGVSSAEQRLRYYAQRFDTVEVDSSFYAIPKPEYAVNWVRRTPSDFTFHVKAYGMMTGHEVDERALHPDLADGGFDYRITPRGRVRDPEERMVERAFELFRESIAPLVEAGKMGGVLMQYPPWFSAVDRDHRHRAMARMERDAELLDPLPVFVEFRHSSWIKGANLGRTTRFLTDRGLTLVAVDAPQLAGGDVMPPVTAATSGLGYVRFHGHNHEMWNAATEHASDRFDYLYTPEELAPWSEPLTRLAEQTERTWVMFNNCKYDYAPTNARQMAELLGDVVAPRTGDASTGEPVEDSGHAENDLASQGQLDLGI
jgi:uncharacterized protein YecE (DUF72 family)